MTQATRTPGPCQVRSKTESPCSRRAEVEIEGVAFCEACAREQEAYFAIGDLTQEKKAQGYGSKPLGEALQRMQRERVGSTEGIEAEMHHGHSSVDEIESPALMKCYPQGILSAATLSSGSRPPEDSGRQSDQLTPL